jgi:myo-inositol 2-dehydrogenase/D-chiro-inositol 1-dehydrogenase
MKTTMTLGIGVIGSGIMGTDHVKTVSSTIAGAEVRAITDIDRSNCVIGWHRE